GKPDGPVRHLGFEPDQLPRGVFRGHPGAGRKVDRVALQPKHVRTLQDAHHQLLEQYGIVNVAVQDLGDIALIEDALFSGDDLQNDLWPTLDAASVFGAAFLLQLDAFEPGRPFLICRLALDRLGADTKMNGRCQLDPLLLVRPTIDADVETGERQMMALAS